MEITRTSCTNMTSSHSFLLALVLSLFANTASSYSSFNFKRNSPSISLNALINNNDNINSNNQIPKTYLSKKSEHLKQMATLLSTASAVFLSNIATSRAEVSENTLAIPISEAAAARNAANAITSAAAAKEYINTDFGAFKIPYFHENLEFKQFLGSKATIVFNMKIDDPQTVIQFPDLAEIFRKYKKDGLNVHAFPTEQGWFEPDDDETCRLKAKEYYTFGDVFPQSVVFDKVDVLGPSAHPFYTAITNSLPTPNGYNRITLNYEKFLLDASGRPVRRYPRKFTAYDMEPDIVALLNNQPLPAETPSFAKAWREAKREVIKGEYSFRYNYNYYTAPESMYKYDPKKDSTK